MTQDTASNIRIQRSANWAMRRAAGHERPDFFDGGEPGFVVHAGEGFARVKRFAVPVEVAVIVRCKGGLACHLAGEQPARQRYPGENPDLTRFRFAEKQLGWAVPEHVKDDLHGLDIRDTRWL